MTAPPTLADVLAARGPVAAIASVTPAVLSEPLSAVIGAPVWLKAECTQVTGSFKVRGAANALSALSDEQRAAGVVAVSSGNHGRAVAHVAAALGIDATVCISSRVPPVKAEAISALGARVVVAGADQDAADAAARRLAQSDGLVLVHPFDDPRVIAGQGTLGLEILDQVPDVRSVVVPMSGGGLIAGIGLAVKGEGGDVTVVGVSQDRGPAMHDSLAAGRLVDVVEVDTLADALAGSLGPVNHHTLDLCRALVDRAVLVSEEQIADAMRFLHSEHALRVEGGGAVGVAALLGGVAEPAGPVVVVVSGGNVADDVLARVLAGAG